MNQLHIQLKIDLATQIYRKMKKSLFILALVFISASAMAQTTSEEIDMIQSIFGKEKKAFVEEFIQMDASQSDAFWKLYYEYETARKELGKKRIALLENYADNYSENMEEEVTGQILKETMALQKSNDKLISSYTNKIKKDVGVMVASQFYQIEEYILAKTRSEILENIPVLGQK